MCGQQSLSLAKLSTRIGEKKFFQFLEPRNKQKEKSSMRMLEYTFSAQSGRLQLCLSFHFLLVRSLKVSQRSELRAFTGLPKHAHSPGQACALLYPRNTSEPFKALDPKAPHYPAFSLPSFQLVYGLFALCCFLLPQTTVTNMCWAVLSRSVVFFRFFVTL